MPSGDSAGGLPTSPIFLSSPHLRKMALALTVSILAAQLFAAFQGVGGQNNTVVCEAGWTWSYNSRQQNPCLVASYLLGTCNGGQYSISPLASGYHYTGPALGYATACQCSTVSYSLVAACSLCQNATMETWSSWSTNCSTVYPLIFPESIPSGTAVPNWAYLDVVTGDNFNAAAAQADGDTPESTGAAKSTGTVLTTPTSPVTSIGFSSSPGSSPTAATLSTKSSSNAGAIAGGVVGGVVGLGLVAGLIAFLLIRSRRSRTPASAAYGSVHTAPQSPQSPPPTTIRSSEYGVSPFMAQQATVPMSQPRLYDPSDPSTFPTSAPSPTLRTTASDYTGSVYSPHGGQIPGQYSGVPEL